MNCTHIQVGLVGLSSIEERHLKITFEYYQNKNRVYEVTSLNDYPDVLFVNADEASSLIEWRLYRETLKQRDISCPPSVLLSENREFNTTHYQLKRTLIATNVIRVLDEVTEKELKNKPNSKRPDINKKISSKPKILIIDDNFSIRKEINRTLRSKANIDFAITGESALKLTDKTKFNIIFLDAFLPDTNGYDICKKIKSNTSKNIDTPVIMLTDNSSPVDRVKGKLAGCDTYLIKPISQFIFLQLVEQYLSLDQYSKASSEIIEQNAVA